MKKLANTCKDDDINKILQNKEPKLQDYRHVYLYAKGHYKRDDRIEDLKVIIAERCILEPQHVSTEDVFNILMTITYEHIRKDLYISMLLQVFGLSKLFPNEPHEIEDGVKVLLGNISIISVLDKDRNVIVNLGKADPKILPLKESIVKVKFEGKITNDETEIFNKLGIKYEEESKLMSGSKSSIISYFKDYNDWSDEDLDELEYTISEH